MTSRPASSSATRPVPSTSAIPLLPATALVLCGALMTRIQDTALNIANPALMADFGLPAATVAWISLAPMLMSASLLTIFGRLADLRGRRNLYALAS